MRCFALSTILLLGLSAPLAAAEPDAAAGQALVDQHCQACHRDEVYTRADRRIRNLEQLRSQVQRCEISQGLKWFETDIENVAAYLNKAYYRF